MIYNYTPSHGKNNPKQSESFYTYNYYGVYFIISLSVYFILEFLKGLQKSLELRICHTSSEDIADSDTDSHAFIYPGIVFHLCTCIV